MFSGSGKKEKPKVSFVTTLPGLENIEECRPKPYRKYMPEWWSKVSLLDDSLPTVKKCPGIMDYFLNGYVVPMWSDVTMSYDSRTQTWKSFLGMNGGDLNWSFHPNNQFIDHVDARFSGKKASFIFKGISPWKVITEPGWSVYQLPLSYHFDNEFTILPGIIDSDIEHTINPQIVYFGDGEDLTITRGTPLVLYVPFRREDIEYDVRSYNEEDLNRFNHSDVHQMTKFPLSGFYRKMQKDRDMKCPYPHHGR